MGEVIRLRDHKKTNGETEIETVEEKNKKNEERLRRERAAKNKKVLRSLRIKS